MPFVNGRGAGYKYDASVLKCAAELRYPDEEEEEEPLDIIHRLCPDTRFEYALNVQRLRDLLNRNRPEQAARLAAHTLEGLQPNDPLAAPVKAALDQARSEIWAKKRAAWEPLWSTQLRRLKEGDEFETVPTALVVDGALIVFETDGEGARRIIALDAASGTRRWGSALHGDLRDMVLSANRRRIFSIVGSGDVASIDVGTGAVQWRATLEAAPAEMVQQRPHRFRAAAEMGLQRLVAAPGEVLACGGKAGMAALSSAEGTVLWTNLRYRPAMLGNEMRRPVAVAETVFVACADGTVRAFSASTGKTIWERSYGDLPESKASSVYRRAPVVLGQPVALSERKILVDARARKVTEVLNARDGAVVRSMPLGTRSFSVRYSVIDGEFLLRYGFQELTTARSLVGGEDDVTHRLPVRGEQIAGINGVVYGSVNTELIAADVRTGAILARFLPGSFFWGGTTVVGDGKVFVITPLGYVAALPLITPPPKDETVR
jgi:outer membrane protein assembly factor BamB